MTELYIPQLVVLDFDRTLGDVDVAVNALYLAAEKSGINVAVIKAAREQVENDGGSFDPFQYVQSQLSAAELQIFETNFKKLGAGILYPDAKEYLQLLKDSAQAHVVLTYGVNADWQKLKIQASGFEGGYKIIDHQDKGQEILNWKKNDMYRFDDLVTQRTFIAPTVTLIDDKASAFDNLPLDCAGILIQRGAVLLKSQQGSIPAHVSRIQSLMTIQQ